MDGYWFLPVPGNWTPPATLTDFLAHGDAPIYVGFGSTITGRAEETGKIIVEAFHRINRRGVLARGWEELNDSSLDPGRFIVVNEIPHDWLFERMAVLIHHGGAGTTASAFRAGVPQLVVPHMQDQPFWGNKTHQLGVGTRPIPRSRLSVDSLARALQSIFDNPSMQTRAREIGEQIRAERGLEKAVAVVERAFGM
jgi:UDP:flavonoid glycosyltransferase YjiC (YdhE family)